MKKLLVKDKKKRARNISFEKKALIFKSIFKNLNFLALARWSAFVGLQRHTINQNSFSNRCLKTISKKRFNSLTFFSRGVLLKLIRKGQVPGVQKSSW